MSVNDVSNECLSMLNNIGNLIDGYLFANWLTAWWAVWGGAG